VPLSGSWGVRTIKSAHPDFVERIDKWLGVGIGVVHKLIEKRVEVHSNEGPRRGLGI
jgi:hypothetical protein